MLSWREKVSRFLSTKILQRNPLCQSNNFGHFLIDKYFDGRKLHESIVLDLQYFIFMVGGLNPVFPRKYLASFLAKIKRKNLVAISISTFVKIKLICFRFSAIYHAFKLFSWRFIPLLVIAVIKRVCTFVC